MEQQPKALVSALEGATCDRDQLHVCSVFDSKQLPAPNQRVQWGEGCHV